MRASILDAQHTVFEGVVSEAILPATDGEMCLLDDHEPIFVALTKGHIRLITKVKKFTKTQSTANTFFIHQGVARMRNNELIILVE